MSPGSQNWGRLRTPNSWIVHFVDCVENAGRLSPWVSLPCSFYICTSMPLVQGSQVPRLTHSASITLILSPVWLAFPESLPVPFSGTPSSLGCPSLLPLPPQVSTRFVHTGQPRTHQPDGQCPLLSQDQLGPLSHPLLHPSQAEKGQGLGRRPPASAVRSRSLTSNLRITQPLSPRSQGLARLDAGQKRIQQEHSVGSWPSQRSSQTGQVSQLPRPPQAARKFLAFSAFSYPNKK